MRQSSRDSGILLVWLAFWLVSCTPSASSYLTSVYRFQEAEPSILLVAAPEDIVLAMRHQTLADEREAVVESRVEPISLAELPEAWAAPLARTLRFFKNAPLRAGGEASPWVVRLRADPRRASQPGYRYLPPFGESSARDESELDTGSRYCLVEGQGRIDRLPRPHWYAFEPKAIAGHFDVSQLLLVAVEQVTVIDTGARPRVTVSIGAYLVDLSKPLLAARFFEEVEITRPDSPSDIESALCASLAELRADDWAPLRRDLARMGERWGFVLAARLGWIGPERLQEEIARWTRENTARIERAR